MPTCELGVPFFAPCKVEVSTTNTLVTSTLGQNASVWSNLTQSSTVRADIPDSYYSNSKMCFLRGESLKPENIKFGVTIFNVLGANLGDFKENAGSNAPRNPGLQIVPHLMPVRPTSRQISIAEEVTTFSNGSHLPSTGEYVYRDIPDREIDDDGENGINCKYAARPAVDCGMSQSTLILRMEDCQNKNPTSYEWNGATSCNSGQGSWKLVTRNGANKEVWQDQRTGLIWSSVLTSTATNWCHASGNSQKRNIRYAGASNQTLQ